ncbi:MAG: hypothetical protein WD431_00190 [Cyclobacteriaceae bacterium]
MNSFASISLLLLFLIKGLVPYMDLCCELLKIPNLFEHYEEHKTCNDGSFWQFLVEDYLNVDGDAQDHRDDSGHDNLPFHGTNTQCCHPPVFYAPDQQFSLIVFEFVQQVEFGHNSTFHPSVYLDSPFQPPKV